MTQKFDGTVIGAGLKKEFEMKREWLGRNFISFGSPTFTCDSNGQIKEEAPQDRYHKADRYGLHQYGAGKFCKFTLRGLPTTSGVYVLCVNQIPQYVGRAVHLQKRFSAGYGNISPKNCYEGGQPTNCRINQLILRSALAGHPIELFVLACDDFVALEKMLILHLKPDWNRQGLIRPHTTSKRTNNENRTPNPDAKPA